MLTNPREVPLFEAALQILQREGVGAVTMQKIANEAGVSFGKVQRYLGGGVDLLDKLAHYVGGEAQDYIEGQLSSDTKHPLHAYIKGTFTWARKRPSHAAFWTLVYHLCMLSSERSAIYRPFMEIGRQRVERLLHESVGRQLYGQVDDVELVSYGIYQQLVGGVIVASSFTQKTTQKLSEQALLQSVDALIRASEQKKSG